MKSDLREKLRSEMLADVAVHIIEALTDCGIDPDIAEQGGAAAVDRMADHWGGAVFTMPKDYAYKLAKREIEILASFTGNNHTELALQYGMTERGIRKLLARAIVRQRDLFQGKLFE